MRLTNFHITDDRGNPNKAVIVNARPTSSPGACPVPRGNPGKTKHAKSVRLQSKLPPTPEPQPKNPFRSVAQRKPIPPAKNLIRDQRFIRKNPIDFANQVLGVRPWQKQQQILNAIATTPYVAVRSCNGAGKTFTAAITILWWLMAHDNAIRHHNRTFRASSPRNPMA